MAAFHSNIVDYVIIRAGSIILYHVQTAGLIYYDY